MRHVHITRLTWLLTGLFAAGAVLFAATGPAQQPAAPTGAAGAATFQAHCAKCHSPREFGRWASLHADAGERRAWLDRLLQRHFTPPDEDRLLIIDYIERTIQEVGG